MRISGSAENSLFETVLHRIESNLYAIDIFICVCVLYAVHLYANGFWRLITQNGLIKPYVRTSQKASGAIWRSTIGRVFNSRRGYLIAFTIDNEIDEEYSVVMMMMMMMIVRLAMQKTIDQFRALEAG